MSELRFLPWLQTGLSQAAEGKGGRATVAAATTIGGGVHRRTLSVSSTGDVSSIDPGVWGTRFPTDGAMDAEETFLASIEVTPADLPWRLSRGPADGDGQLDPWFVLIVIDTAQGVELIDGVGTPLRQLVLSPDAEPSTQLPDLNERSTFVHVQSTVTPEQLVAGPTAAGVKARLLCPRDLASHRRYLAAVVPATAEGVLAGRGLATAPATRTALAWDLTDARLDSRGITLPVYTHWTFSTGPDGDFESLTRQIRGAGLGRRTGLAALDISDPGPSVPASRKRVTVDYHGALRAPEVRERAWDPEHQELFQATLRKVLDASVDRPTVPKNEPARYRPLRDDPVIAPPLYGEMTAGLTSVPDDPKRWGHELNLDPAWRAAAGVGANAVRARSAEYVAAAWRQLADAPAVVAATNRAVFGAAVSQRLAAGVAKAQDATLLNLTSRLPAAQGVGLGVPSGLNDPVIARVTRAAGPVGRRFSESLATATSTRPDTRGDSIAVSVSSVHRAALSGDVGALVIREFAAFTGVSGAMMDPVILTAEPVTFASARTARRQRIPSRPSVASTSSQASQVRTALDPSALLTASLAQRVPAAAGVLATAPAPQTVSVALEFPTAIVAQVIAQGQHLLLPGIDEFEENSAALAVVEPRTIAAVLAGANHEVLREMLWHGVPIDLRQTPIRRFWETGDLSDRDIQPIVRWSDGLESALTKRAAKASAVVVVRATLFRRYPTARIHLVGGMWNGDRLRPDPARLRDPIFEGWLDPSTRYAGFDLTPEQLAGNLGATRRTKQSAGWFFALEEAPTAPRFRPQPQRGANSAAHAVAAYQPPFRGLVHATEMLEPR